MLPANLDPLPKDVIQNFQLLSLSDVCRLALNFAIIVSSLLYTLVLYYMFSEQRIIGNVLNENVPHLLFFESYQASLSLSLFKRKLALLWLVHTHSISFMFLRCCYCSPVCWYSMSNIITIPVFTSFGLVFAIVPGISFGSSICTTKMLSPILFSAFLFPPAH